MCHGLADNALSKSIKVIAGYNRARASDPYPSILQFCISNIELLIGYVVNVDAVDIPSVDVALTEFHCGFDLTVDNICSLIGKATCTLPYLSGSWIQPSYPQVT